MSNKFKYSGGLVAFALAVIIGANYFIPHRSVQRVLDSDPRNAGINVFAHYEYFILPSVLVIDLRNVSGENSPADVTRVLLQYAQSQKNKEYSQVKLASHGDQKFLMRGDYFKTLGVEFGEQNPIYTMRTLPENIFHLDGTAAFGTWSGGVLGVLGKQMEDFTEFHKQWYIADYAK